MRLFGLLLAATLFSSAASAQEYIQQQTKAQCDARGGRITQWMSSPGVFPEVGTCFVPPGRSSSGSTSSRSCAAYDRAFAQYENLPEVPDDATPARHCSHYRQAVRLLEQALEGLPCDDFTDAYPAKLRQSTGRLRGIASNWCARAEREEAEATRPAPQPRPIDAPAPAPSAKDPTQRAGYVGPNVAVVTKESVRLGPDVSVAPKAAPSPQPMDEPAPRQEAALPSWVPSFQDLPSPAGRTKQEVATDDATVKNCVDLKQVGKLDFQATNQCPFPVRIKIQSMNFDHSPATERRYLSGRGGYTNISSYWELPTISGAN